MGAKGIVVALGISALLVAGCGDDAGKNISLPDVSIPDVSVPNLDDLGDLGDCAEAAAAYAGIGMTALVGEDEANKAAEVLEKLKVELPDELHGDLVTVMQGYRTFVEDGITKGKEALDTREFKEAWGRISQYFDQQCRLGDG